MHLNYCQWVLVQLRTAGHSTTHIIATQQADRYSRTRGGGLLIYIKDLKVVECKTLSNKRRRQTANNVRLRGTNEHS